jgi:phosphoribosylaminoimidazole (AIR) synthetase
VVPPPDADEACRLLATRGIEAWEIGDIVAGDGHVHLRSG